LLLKYFNLLKHVGKLYDAYETRREDLYRLNFKDLYACKFGVVIWWLSNPISLPSCQTTSSTSEFYPLLWKCWWVYYCSFK